MSSTAIRKMGASLTGVSLLLAAGHVAAVQPYNMPVGVTEVSRTLYGLHMLIFWICVAIGVGVFGVMFYSIVKHRKSKGHEAAQFHESTSVEVIWTAIPFMILIAIAIPASKALIALEDSSEADMTVQITGYQWKWKYDYLDEGISFFSNLATPREQIYDKAEKGENYLLEVDNEVVLPINKKIRFLMTANDVIHAWWVPALAVKQDAIPGFVNETWARIEKPGVYRGQCAELCGRDHGFMPIVVRAVEQDEYDKWVLEQQGATAAQGATADKQWTDDELMAKGKEVYAASCATCHQPNGEGMPGTFPSIKGSPIATGDQGQHLDVVMNGKPGTAMAAFGPQLDDVEIAAVTSYQRNAFGNETGDFIQPTAIKALR